MRIIAAAKVTSDLTADEECRLHRELRKEMQPCREMQPCSKSRTGKITVK